MHNFDNVMVTYRIGSSGTRYLYLRASHKERYEVRSDPGNVAYDTLEGVFEDRRVANDYRDSLRARLPPARTFHVEDVTKPSVWFCFEWSDFLRMRYVWQDACADGYHTCKKAGPEHWMFFDLEIPSLKDGQTSFKRKVAVKMVRLDPTAANILIRYGERVFRMLQTRNPHEQSMEHTVELSKDRRARWADRYGQAKGDVEVVIDERVRDLYEQRLSDPELLDCIEQLKNITRNGTYNKWQTGTLRLSKDGERSIYFQIHAPDGRRTMNGVVLDHSTGDGVNWSIHT